MIEMPGRNDSQSIDWVLKAASNVSGSSLRFSIADSGTLKVWQRVLHQALAVYLRLP